MLLNKLRLTLPEDSVFRHPLVFDIALVLALKLGLLVLLWQLTFKPLLAQSQLEVTRQLGVLPTSQIHSAALSAPSSAATPAILQPEQDDHHD